MKCQRDKLAGHERRGGGENVVEVSPEGALWRHQSRLHGVSLQRIDPSWSENRTPIFFKIFLTSSTLNSRLASLAHVLRWWVALWQSHALTFTASEEALRSRSSTS